MVGQGSGRLSAAGLISRRIIRDSDRPARGERLTRSHRSNDRPTHPQQRAPPDPKATAQWVHPAPHSGTDMGFDARKRPTGHCGWATQLAVHVSRAAMSMSCLRKNRSAPQLFISAGRSAGLSGGHQDDSANQHRRPPLSGPGSCLECDIRPCPRPSGGQPRRCGLAHSVRELSGCGVHVWDPEGGSTLMT
jgi:hypothetical protein